jgi:hypothetical protein
MCQSVVAFASRLIVQTASGCCQASGDDENGRTVRALRQGSSPGREEQHETSITMVEGIPMPSFCDHGRWDSLRTKLKGALRPEDIVVSTYPKCGTTWTEQVALLLLNDGDTSVLNPATKNSFNPETQIGKIWFEAMVDTPGRGPRGGGDSGRGEFQTIKSTDFSQLLSPRLIKTHNAVSLFVGGNNEEQGGVSMVPPCGGARVVCE